MEGKISKEDINRLKVLKYKMKGYFWLWFKISRITNYVENERQKCHDEYITILRKYN